MPTESGLRRLFDVHEERPTAVGIQTVTGMLRRTPRTIATRRLVVIAVLAGAVLGIVAVGGFRISPAVEIFMSQFGVFVVVPAAIGFFARTRRGAVLTATLLLVVMCVVYYLPYADSVVSFLISAAVWTVLSLVAGPVFGLAGNALRTDDRRGVIAAAGLIGLLAGEFIRMSQKGLIQGDLDVLSLTVVFDALAVIGIVLLLRPDRIGRVALYAIPMTALGYLVTFVLR